MTNQDRSGRLESRVSRRKLLAGLGTVGIAGLAGCGGGGGGTPSGAGTSTPTQGVPDLGTGTGEDTVTGTQSGPGTSAPGPDLADVSGQTFTLPMTTNPEEVTFLRHYPGGDYTISNTVWNALFEPELYGRWMNTSYLVNPGETFSGVYESIDFLDDGIQIRIRDDAKWSDGEDITAKDPGGNAALWIMEALPDDRGEWPVRDTESATTHHVFHDLEFPEGMDGKVLKYVDTEGYMDRFGDYRLLSNPFEGRLGVRGAAHIEPLESLYDAALDNLQSAVEGGDYLQKNELIREHVLGVDPRSTVEQPDPTPAQQMRDPDHLVTSGAWELSEIRGAQGIVLEPNEHWHSADNVNFDRLEYTYADNEERQRASLFSDRLDFLSGALPTGSEEVLPSQFAKQRVPANGGDGLGIDHSDPHLGNRDVRAAIMYALNKEDIATNVHTTATAPYQVPGGDNWAHEAVYSNEWVENTLIDYTQDRERADELMRNNGYTKQGGVWTSEDGEELSYELPTTSQSPVFEETVASQLTNWGLELNVQGYDTATYDEMLNDTREFPIWTTGQTGDRWAGYYERVASHWHWSLNTTYKLQRWNFFDEEAQEEALEGYANNSWLSGNWELYEGLEIMVPPAGQPDGELEAFAPGYAYMYNDRGGGQFTSDLWKRFAWVQNWFLPGLALYLDYDVSYYDDDHWLWPTDHYMWEYFQVSMDQNRMLSSGMIQADPENPESDATVQ